MNAASVTSSERSCDGICETASSASGIIFWDTVLAARGLTAGAKAAAPVRRSARSFIVLRAIGGVRGSVVGLSLFVRLSVYASLAPEIGLAATAYGSQCVSRREPVAPLAHGGQRSAAGKLDLGHAANREPSAQKFLPQAIGAIAATGETLP